MNTHASSLLIVEDDQDLRDLLIDLLSVDGHDIRSAPNGIEALHAMDTRYPQLVITDLEMPALDGLSLINRMFIENLGRENVPVILMSASPRLEEVAEAAGTPYAIAKPFNLEALQALIARALDEATPPRPPKLASAGPSERASAP